jgi:hypothetical protein
MQARRKETQMQRGLLCALAMTVAVLALFAGGASASGPAPPGKEAIELSCEGLGPLTVSVARSENNNGAGQIVGEKGHGMPVSSTFTLTDVSTSTLIDEESKVTGGGHAHHNQATTGCSGVLFEGPASAFFGEGPLPEGVSSGDTIRASLVIDVILKL